MNFVTWIVELYCIYFFGGFSLITFIKIVFKSQSDSKVDTCMDRLLIGMLR